MLARIEEMQVRHFAWHTPACLDLQDDLRGVASSGWSKHIQNSRRQRRGVQAAPGSQAAALKILSVLRVPVPNRLQSSSAC